MSENQVKAGTLVRSLAGRDKDRVYVAVSVHDGRAFLSDGRKHRLSSPKAKNPRHISPIGELKTEISGLSDKKLRRLIFEFKTQNEEKSLNTNTVP